MKRAFTLIELIVVIVVIGLVTFIVSVLLMGIIRRTKYEANKRSIEAYARVVETAMDTYQIEHLRYPDSIDELDIEYTGSVIECGISRINPDYTIYLDECKVNGKQVDYHYGTLVLTDKEYVDKLGKNIEIALKDYHDEHNKYPINYRLLSLPELDKDVKCASEINQDGTVYLTNCTVDGVKVLANDTEDGYYHYGSIIPPAIEYLLNKSNGIEVTNYIDGNTHEMYKFDHPSTTQTSALTDYRYIGNVPYNYVTFNGNETWRIIGIFNVEDENSNFEERIKLVRNDSLGNRSWGENGNNEWSDSLLQAYLNEEYILNNASKRMIDNVKLYLGKTYDYSASASNFYNIERGGNNSLNWIGKIELIYPSDYLYTYGLGVDDSCYNFPPSCRSNSTGIPASGWLYSGISEWTLISNPYNNTVFYIKAGGTIGYGATDKEALQQ